MDSLINGIANFFIQHPFAQVIAGYLGKLLGWLFAILLIASCIFLAFGQQRSFYYQKGSLAGICWKVGWLLQIISVTDLSCRLFFLGTKHMYVPELVIYAAPILILLFAQIYGMKYHKTMVVAKRIARQKLS